MNFYPTGLLSGVSPEIVFRDVREKGGGTVSRALYPRLAFEGRRGMTGTIELHSDEERARDGALLTQKYVSGTLGLLPSKSLANLSVSVRLGDEVDLEGSRVGTGRRIGLETTIRAYDHLVNEIAWEHRSLNAGERPVFSADTVRGRFSWTFNARSFARLIAEWQDVERHGENGGEVAHDGFLSGSILYGYRLNWRSILYVGYGDERVLSVDGNLDHPRKDLFLKVSYAIQR